MKGKELSKYFFYDLIFPLLKAKYNNNLQFISIAFMGEGSEVLGFDDNLSNDHNFIPRLIIFIDDEKYSLLKNDMKKYIYDNLPIKFKNFVIAKSGYVKSIEIVALKEYIFKYLNISNFPKNDIEWLKFDEQKLLEITSGNIFYDWNNQLKKILNLFLFYPENIKYFLIYQGFLRLSESDGIVRCLERKDHISTMLYKSFFIYFTIKIFHLLSEKYCPYRKWMGHNIKHINSKGYIFHDLIENLSKTSDFKEILIIIQNIMEFLTKEIYALLKATPKNIWIKSKLNLLNYNYDDLFLELKKKIPKKLQTLRPCITPPKFWGILFSFDGFGFSFEETLKANLDL